MVTTIIRNLPLGSLKIELTTTEIEFLIKIATPLLLEA
jgi:hypothetical protein